jgi:hypothetical protein
MARNRIDPNDTNDPGQGVGWCGERYRALVNETASDQSEVDRSKTWVDLVAVIGVVAAIGTFFFVTFIAPDGGFTAASMRQGVAIGALVAAVPVTVLAGGDDAGRLVSLGGGMAVAGAVTTPGGNLAGVIMAGVGVALLLAGGSSQPTLTRISIIRLLVYGVLLAVGSRLALGTGVLSGLAALAIAVSVPTLGHGGREVGSLVGKPPPPEKGAL